MRKTKIIATLGPNAENKEILYEMAKIMDVARFNFSHGDYAEHKKKLKLLDEVCNELNRPIARLLDTKGPEIRTGINKNRHKINLVKGNKIIISMEECECDDEKIYVNYERLIDDINIGNNILLDDGLIELKVINIDYLKKDIECEVEVPGELGEHKGVNVPGLSINLPDITDKDKKDIIFGIEEGFDIIAASFVRSKNCIKEIRKILEENNSNMKIIAKIENEEGIRNLDEIMNEADGIMIARGDLGVEIDTCEVPYFQKEIIKKCNGRGKIVITATQMLDSMIRNPRPTRAETTDVANAIYDGTDCVMLSGETANGKYPIEAIKMMERIALESEKHIDYNARREKIFLHDLDKTITNTVCKMSVNSANILEAKAIVAPTLSGHTALILSKYKPNIPIYALTNDKNVCRQLMLCYAVTPLYWSRPNSSDLIVGDSIVKLKNERILKNGDVCIVAFGVDTDENGSRVKMHTNTMRVVTVY